MKKPATLGVVILAGGRGQRMGGQDKGWIRYQGEYLIQQVLEQFQCQFDGPLVISANRHLEDYRQLGFPVIADQDVIALDYAGPLVGLLGAMETGLAKYWLCWPVDAPHLPESYVAQARELFQLDSREGSVKIIQTFQTGRLEPLHLGVHRGLSAHLRAYLDAGHRSVKDWSNAMASSYPDHTRNRQFAEGSLTNLNFISQLGSD